MKSISLLIIGLLVGLPAFSNTEKLPEERYWFLLKKEKAYHFVMEVINSSPSTLTLKSTQVFKKNQWRIQVDTKVPKDHRYYQYDSYQNWPESQDDTVSLELQLENLTSNDGEQYYRTRLFDFREKMVPYLSARDGILSHIQLIRDLYGEDAVSGQDALWSAKLHTFVANEYSEVEESSYDRYSWSKKPGKVVETRQIPNGDFSFDLNIKSSGFFAYIDSNNRNSLNTEGINSFYLEKSDLIAEKMSKFLLKSDDINIAYNMRGITTLLPLQVSYYDKKTYKEESKKWPAATISNPYAKNDNLYCVRKSSKHFSCSINFVFYRRLLMPGPMDQSNNEIPWFMVDSLKNKGIDRDAIIDGTQKLDYGSLKY